MKFDLGNLLGVCGVCMRAGRGGGGGGWVVTLREYYNVHFKFVIVRPRIIER